MLKRLGVLSVALSVSGCLVPDRLVAAINPDSGAALALDGGGECAPCFEDSQCAEGRCIQLDASEVGVCALPCRDDATCAEADLECFGFSDGKSGCLPPDLSCARVSELAR